MMRITNYSRPGLIEKKLMKDDRVEFIEKLNNFYGQFIRVSKNDIKYDIKPENLDNA